MAEAEREEVADDDFTRVEPGATLGPRASTEVDPLPHGRLFGRYSLLRQLGRGGMGTVYSAYDEELGRKVAIKLLRHDPRETDAGAGARLLGEAQALARLSHPNVVQIYDVGEVGGQVFLAMEYVQGQTLREFQRAAQRSWREVIALYRQAGEGLAAAHQAGLVHRDFKPDNAIVGEDGRVRVLDFGLAARREAPSADAESIVASARSTGSLVGTPAYMSPEQHLRLAADARSDQFSFCVALYEALHGERPFRGKTVGELAQAALAGTIAPPPVGRRIPGWLRQAVIRGLAASPDERHPSMRALLVALDPDRRRRRALAVAAALLAIVAALAIAWGLRARAATICSGADDHLRGVWDDERAAAVAAGLRATGLPYAEDVWSRVRERLDADTQAWTAMYTEACEATALRRVQSAELLDRRMECLRDHLGTTRALVERLADADREIAERAIQAVAGLPPLAACADAGTLLAGVRPPADEHRAAVDALRARLNTLHADELAGRFGAADEAAAVAHEAEAIGYRPLVAEAYLQRGRLAAGRGDFADAEAQLGEAFWIADAAGDDRVRAEAAIALVEVVGAHLGRPPQGRVWGRHAEAILLRRGDAGTPLLATHHRNLGALLQIEGDLDGAEEHLGRALDLDRRLGADRPEIARDLKLLGNVAYRRGLYVRAGEDWAAALDLAERVLGPNHPEIAPLVSNLGESLRVQGDLGAAERHFRRALAIWEAALGDSSPKLAGALGGLGAVAYDRGDYAESGAWYRRLLAVIEGGAGEDHPTAATARTNLCEVELLAGAVDRAEEECRRAIAILERTLGPSHDALGDPLTNLAGVLVARGDFDGAAASLDRVMALWEGGHGPDFAELAKPLGARGHLELARARPAAAIAPLERALALRQRTGASAAELALLRHDLADALWAEGSARARARQLGADARDALAGADAPAARRARQKLDAWLAAHQL